MDEAVDYSTPGEARTVYMYVRPHNRYGNSPAGTLVRIDEAELEVPTTLAALWTAQDRDAAAAAAVQAEEVAKAAADPGAPLREAIRKALASIPPRPPKPPDKPQE